MQDSKEAIIITGANGNIGSALASVLAEEGFNLILHYHNSHQRIDGLTKKFSSSVVSIRGDLTDLNQLEKEMQQCCNETGFSPLALVHTAAKRSIDSASLSDTTPELWKSIFDTNVIGSYNILKVVIPLMRQRYYSDRTSEKSRIVLLGSDVSRIGLPYGSAYAASKAAVSNLARSLAAELADSGILINIVSPGPVDIDDSHFPEEYRRFRAEYYSEILKRIPLKRLARPGDVISLCKFLISEENRYLTGEEFFLTGGKL